MKRTKTKNRQNLWNRAFDACVELLQKSADALDPYVPGGMDYCKINAILFCIILPIVMGLSLGLNAYLLHKLLSKDWALP